jgi:hypothetical protein
MLRRMISLNRKGVMEGRTTIWQPNGYRCSLQSLPCIVWVIDSTGMGLVGLVARTKAEKCINFGRNI